MKYAFAAFLLVLAFSTAFIFKISDTEKYNSTQTLPLSTNDNRWNDKFFVGAMDDDGDHYNGHYFNQLDQLGFNLWHNYTFCEKDADGRFYPQGRWIDRVINDRVPAPASTWELPKTILK